MARMWERTHAVRTWFQRWFTSNSGLQSSRKTEIYSTVSQYHGNWKSFAKSQPIPRQLRGHELGFEWIWEISLSLTCLGLRVINRHPCWWQNLVLDLSVREVKRLYGRLNSCRTGECVAKNTIFCYMCTRRLSKRLKSWLFTMLLNPIYTQKFYTWSPVFKLWSENPNFGWFNCNFSSSKPDQCSLLI